MRPVPSPEDLQCFLEVARLSSFKGAARALALTPGAVSLRVKGLEELLGVQLLTRTTRSVALTTNGHAFVAKAEAVLRTVDDAVRAARGEAPGPAIDLRLGTRHELGMSWIVPMLPDLESAFPSFTFHLYFGSGPDLLLRVRAREIDCAVTSTRLTDPKLDSRVLHEEAYVLVGAPSLLATTPLGRPDDARRHVLIDTHEELPLYRYLRDAPGGVGDLRFAAVRRMGTIAAIRALVLAGAGIAVLPEYYVRRDLGRKRLKRLLPRAPVLSDQFRLVFHARDPLAGYFDALAAQMRDRPLT